MYNSFEEFVAVRTSCHLVEQVDGEFFCDCRLGINGKLCAHSMGPVYDRKKDFPIDPRLNPLRFKRKRKVGRPKKLGLALTREQPLLPGDLQGAGGSQGGGAQAAGEGSGGARAGTTHGGGRAVENRGSGRRRLRKAGVNREAQNAVFDEGG